MTSYDFLIPLPLRSSEPAWSTARFNASSYTSRLTLSLPPLDNVCPLAAACSGLGTFSMSPRSMRMASSRNCCSFAGSSGVFGTTSDSHFREPSGSTLSADFPSLFNNGSPLGKPALLENPMGMLGSFLRFRTAAVRLRTVVATSRLLPSSSPEVCWRLKPSSRLLLLWLRERLTSSWLVRSGPLRRVRRLPLRVRPRSRPSSCPRLCCR